MTVVAGTSSSVTVCPEPSVYVHSPSDAAKPTDGATMDTVRTAHAAADLKRILRC